MHTDLEMMIKCIVITEVAQEKQSLHCQLLQTRTKKRRRSLSSDGEAVKQNLVKTLAPSHARTEEKKGKKLAVDRDPNRYMRTHTDYKMLPVYSDEAHVITLLTLQRLTSRDEGSR